MKIINKDKWDSENYKMVKEMCNEDIMMFNFKFNGYE